VVVCPPPTLSSFVAECFSSFHCHISVVATILRASRTVIAVPASVAHTVLFSRTGHARWTARLLLKSSNVHFPLSSTVCADMSVKALVEHTWFASFLKMTTTPTGSSRRPIRTPTNELHKRLQKDVCSTCGMLTSAFGSVFRAVLVCSSEQASLLPRLRVLAP